MNSLTRAYIVPCLMLALAAVSAGCAQSADQSVGAASSDVIAAESFTDKVKAAYEDSVVHHRPEWLAGEKVVTRSELPARAQIDFDANAETSEGYGYGYPEVRMATVDGQTVYAISGIVSDTGDILGFYDAKGDKLCEAYSGQGEQPNENGVDWWQ